MNLRQMRAQVRDNLSAGGGANTNFPQDDWWSDAEIDGHISEGQSQIAKVIRRASSDFFVEQMKSTDGVIQIGYENYAPSSLALVVGINLYTLPPDFLLLKKFMSADPQDRFVRFTSSDMAKEEFFRLFGKEGSNDTEEYFFDIIGQRTLALAPTPQATLDTWLFYERLLRPLAEYKVGTVSMTRGSAIVTGVGTLFENQVCPGAQLVAGTVAADPVALPSTIYPSVLSVDNDTQITLEAPWFQPTLAGAKYTLADAPFEIPSNHHWLITAWATAEAFRKGVGADAQAVALWADKYRSMLPDLISDVETRQASDPEFVQQYLEDE